MLGCLPGFLPRPAKRLAGAVKNDKPSALSERLGAGPYPSATLDLSEYHSLNCETVRPSHCSRGDH